MFISIIIHCWIEMFFSLMLGNIFHNLLTCETPPPPIYKNIAPVCFYVQLYTCLIFCFFRDMRCCKFVNIAVFHSKQSLFYSMWSSLLCVAIYVYMYICIYMLSCWQFYTLNFICKVVFKRFLVLHKHLNIYLKKNKKKGNYRY